MIQLITWISSTFIFGILMFFYLKKQPQFRKQNFFIFFALVSTWIGIGIYESVTRSHKLQFGSWELPALFLTYYFLQAFFRMTFAVLSRRLKSRVWIMRIALISFFVLTLIGVVIDDKITIWLITIGSAILACTYGLQNQYFVENYDIRRVFRTVGIVYAIPLFGRSIGQIFYISFNLADSNLEWVWAFSIVLTLIPLTFFFAIKENKKTIRLDENIPNSHRYAFLLKESLTLFISIFVLAFCYFGITSHLVAEKYNVISVNDWYYTLPITFLSVFIAIFFNVTLLKKIGIVSVKIIGYSFLIAGIIFSIIFLDTTSLDHFDYLIGYAISSIGFGILFTVNFGAALHADVKNRELISAAFLSCFSLGAGLGLFYSQAIILNLESGFTALQIIYYISLTLSCFAIGFSLIFDRKSRHIFTKAIQYEFLNTKK